MKEHATHHYNYLPVWIVLMVLMLGSVAITRIHLPPAVNASVVFGSAFAKAAIVGLFFMHLKGEHFAVLGFVLTALVLFVIMTVLLIPDFVMAPGARTSELLAPVLPLLARPLA